VAQGYDSDPEPAGEDACCDQGAIRPMNWGRVLEREMVDMSISINGRSFTRDSFRSIIRYINHANDMFRPESRGYAKTDHRPRIELNNVAHLAGHYTRDKWLKNLVGIENDVEFCQDVFGVCSTMFSETWSTFRELRRLMISQPAPSRVRVTNEVKSKFEALDTLRKELNEELNKIGTEYNRNYPKFDDNFWMNDVKVQSDPQAKKKRPAAEALTPDEIERKKRSIFD
jgi:hypothetical protein